MIMVQREFRIAREHRATFEQQSREGLWPAFLHFGAPMVAFGSWGFGGPSDPFVTHTVYEDFAHWQATRAGGAMYQDPAIRAEIEPFLAVYGKRNEMVESSEAQLFELLDGISRPQPFYRRPGQQVLAAPPTFGKGSIISERTLALTDGTREEFLRVSRDTVWPWLETQGGRGIAIGHNLMGMSNEITTWFAFPSYAEWHRCTRPATAHAPQPVVDAYYARAGLVRHQRGRLLVIGTEFGTRV